MTRNAEIRWHLVRAAGPKFPQWLELGRNVWIRVAWTVASSSESFHQSYVITTVSFFTIANLLTINDIR